MSDQTKNIKTQQLLIKWYNLNKRDLPWRNTDDPYTIWISEIILQQTRVDQGHAYFVRFIEHFSDIKALAEAEEEDVLKLWQGLGYYSRARNLHEAAKHIVKHFNGVFPDNYTDVLSLKGIGEYTAAAIVSFSYNLPYATVDGNVYRVLSRLYAIDDPIDSGYGKKIFAKLAQDLLNKNDPATHNQAMMELGALQCVPANPNCVACPLCEYCLAFISGTVSKYPVKEGKTKVKTRFFNYLDIRCSSHIYLNKRIGNDIWKNLYELPLIESDKQLSLEELQQQPAFEHLFVNAGNIIIEHSISTIKHILSHRIIYATFYKIQIENEADIKKNYIETSVKFLSEFPISRLVDRYFEKALEEKDSQ